MNQPAPHDQVKICLKREVKGEIKEKYEKTQAMESVFADGAAFHQHAAARTDPDRSCE